MSDSKSLYDPQTCMTHKFIMPKGNITDVNVILSLINSSIRLYENGDLGIDVLTEISKNKVKSKEILNANILTTVSHQQKIPLRPIIENISQISVDNELVCGSDVKLELEESIDILLNLINETYFWMFDLDHFDTNFHFQTKDIFWANIKSLVLNIVGMGLLIYPIIQSAIDQNYSVMISNIVSMVVVFVGYVFTYISSDLNNKSKANERQIMITEFKSSLRQRLVNLMIVLHIKVKVKSTPSESEVKKKRIGSFKQLTVQTPHNEDIKFTPATGGLTQPLLQVAAEIPLPDKDKR